MSSSPAAAASSPPPPPATAADDGARGAAEPVAVDERVASHVDPFLVEALDNPRHRLMADAGNKNGAPKTVEERIEEYNKARARIFNGSISADTDAASVLGTFSSGRDEPANVEPSADEVRVSTMNSRSRVAVFKDTQKDRSDPDYDRNYKRYVRSPVPDFNMNPGAFNFVVPQFMQYGVGYVQTPGMSANQPTVYFGQPDLSMGSSSGAVYPHWPTPAMMYPHCYDNTGPMISQVPLYQSFNHG
nr:unnamed protein product [Digitaria exilis]